jgi:hypothetical protein
MQDDQVLGTVKVDDQIIELIVKRYANGNPAIIGYDRATGKKFSNLSFNLVSPDLTAEQTLEPGDIMIKTWSENEVFAQRVRESGLFLDTGKRICLQFAEAEVWRLAAEN